MQKVNCHFKKHTLQFTFDAGTSRGVLRTKATYFIFITDSQCTGIGEASPLIGLSVETPNEDAFVGYEEKLSQVCAGIDFLPKSITEMYVFLAQLALDDYPSIYFGLEMALIDFYKGGNKLLFESAFSMREAPIPINGLVWMGNEGFMKEQIAQKIAKGFRTIKMKIGAIDWATEYRLLQAMREQFSAEELTLRVDANGAFDETNVVSILEMLGDLQVHSIEQPIAPKQSELMRSLCAKTPVSIALDEELIGVTEREQKKRLLEHMRPHYIILKPSLVGGFRACDEWIAIAKEMNVGWWMTSALESNIGLNAIAQYTAFKEVNLPQGLGTGGLFHNNIDSPLTITQGTLLFRQGEVWGELPFKE